MGQGRTGMVFMALSLVMWKSGNEQGAVGSESYGRGRGEGVG